jgi:uncharacterized protein with HEPN domain
LSRHPRDDTIRLADIDQAARMIEEYTADGEAKFLGSKMAQDAVIRQLEVIGEAAGNVSGELRSNHSEVPWRAMHGFASFAKHEYWRVNARLIWKAAIECKSIRLAVGRIRTD